LSKNRVPIRIAHKQLLNAVSAITAGIRQPECGQTLGQP